MTIQNRQWHIYIYIYIYIFFFFFYFFMHFDRGIIFFDWISTHFLQLWRFSWFSWVQNFVFCPYNHSRSILGVFHHASDPSIMVYHKFTQTQHGPMSELTTESFPWPCHVENQMYFVYITNIWMISEKFPR